MQLTSIKTFEDAILFASKCLDGDINIENIVFSEDLNLIIKIDGEKWQGDIDYKIASFVLRMQSEIIKIYNFYTGNNITIASIDNKEYNVRISFIVEPGCTQIIARLADVLQRIPGQVVNKMESKHLLIALVAWIVFSHGEKIYDSYNKSLLKIEEIESDKQKYEQLVKVMSEALEVAKDSQSHMAYIARKISAADTITINDNKMTKKEATERFREKPQPSSTPLVETYYVDDAYQVTGSDVEKHSVKIRNSIIGTKLVSTDLLSEGDKKSLYDMLALADIGGYVPSIDLNVVLETSDGNLAAINVVGLGTKRPGAISLADALRSSGEKTEKRARESGKAFQSSLFDLLE